VGEVEVREGEREEGKKERARLEKDVHFRRKLRSDD
jgi:hypothetical protein